MWLEQNRERRRRSRWGQKGSWCQIHRDFQAEVRILMEAVRGLSRGMTWFGFCFKETLWLMYAKDPKKQHDQWGHHENKNNPGRSWWSSRLGRYLWKWWEMTLTPDRFQRADRLSSAGTYLLPLQWGFPSMPHLFLPCLGPRRLIHTGCPLSLSSLWVWLMRNSCSRRSEGRWPEFGILFPLSSCHHELTVTVFLGCSLPFSYPLRIPGSLSQSSLLYTWG